MDIYTIQSQYYIRTCHVLVFLTLCRSYCLTIFSVPVVRDSLFLYVSKNSLFFHCWHVSSYTCNISDCIYLVYVYSTSKYFNIVLTGVSNNFDSSNFRYFWEFIQNSLDVSHPAIC